MARRIANNPSGKYLQMTDAQADREQAKFERAVQRQRERDAARAREGRQPYATIFVHGDALTRAREVLNSVGYLKPLTQSDMEALQAVIFPSGTVDQFGYVPNVRRSQLLPKS